MAQKKIEVDENEYNASLAVVATVNQMLANPKAKDLVLRARKEADPKAIIPELEAKLASESVLGSMEKKLDDFISNQNKVREETEANRVKNDFADKWRRGQALARESGYMDKGLERLEAFMEKEGVADHRIAIPAFEALHPEPAPATPGIGGSFDFFSAPIEGDKEDFDRLMKSRGDDVGATNNLINKALAESRGQNALRI